MLANSGMNRKTVPFRVRGGYGSLAVKLCCSLHVCAALTAVVLKNAVPSLLIPFRTTTLEAQVPLFQKRCFQTEAMGWRDGWMVKRAYHSCRELELDSLNYLSLQLQRI